jgi:hypothetical protein
MNRSIDVDFCVANTLDPSISPRIPSGKIGKVHGETIASLGVLHESVIVRAMKIETSRGVKYIRPIPLETVEIDAGPLQPELDIVSVFAKTRLMDHWRFRCHCLLPC